MFLNKCISDSWIKSRMVEWMPTDEFLYKKRMFSESRFPALPTSKVFIFEKRIKIQKLLFIVITGHWNNIDSFAIILLKKTYLMCFLQYFLNCSVEARFLRFELWVCWWPAVWAWATYSAFLSSVSSYVEDLMYYLSPQNICED